MSPDILPFRRNGRVPDDACYTCKRKTSSDQKLLGCSVCKSAQYCSKECQKQDWRGHKVLCKRTRAILDEFAELEKLRLTSSSPAVTVQTKVVKDFIKIHRAFLETSIWELSVLDPPPDPATEVLIYNYSYRVDSGGGNPARILQLNDAIITKRSLLFQYPSLLESWEQAQTEPLIMPPSKFRTLAPMPVLYLVPKQVAVWDRIVPRVQDRGLDSLDTKDVSDVVLFVHRLESVMNMGFVKLDDGSPPGRFFKVGGKWEWKPFLLQDMRQFAMEHAPNFF